MKKTIFFIPLLMILNASFGQQTNPVLELTKQDYLQKSKKQKKTGSVFFAVGAGLIITSVILPKGELLYDGICIFGFCDDKYQNDGMKAALGLTGVVSLLGSIPFFVASGKNK